MFVIALASALAFSVPDTVDVQDRQPAGPVDVAVGIIAPFTDTVPRKRAKAVELSDAYATRLTIHRIASYTTIPLFAAQYFSGEALFNADEKGLPRPSWANSLHVPLAVGLAGLFAVNSVTGALNWWETRNDPKGRTWRTIHAALMLVSDAGFAYAGSLGGKATHSTDGRNEHRQWALGSMGVALASYVMMLGPIRGDR